MTPLLLLSALGCVTLDDGTGADLVLWSGTVFEDPYLGTESTGLTGGGLVAVDLANAELAVGAESESTPGSYSLEVPAGADLAMRVTGPAHVPTVFRGRAPTARGLWFNGALFGRQADPLAAFLDGIALPDGGAPADLGDGDVAHLWVEPAEPDALADATIDLVDGEGAPGAIVVLTTAPDGSLVLAESGDAPTLILGLDLAPGDVTLALEAADGRTAETTWPARGGDLLAGPQFALSAE
jgi:hypothetical protein